MYVSDPGDPSPPSTSNFIPEFPRLCSTLTWNPSGTKLALSFGDLDSIPLSGSDGETLLHIVDAASGKALLEVKHPRYIRAVSWHPGGSKLAIGSSAGVRILDATTGAVEVEVRRQAELVALAINPSWTKLAVGFSDGKLRIVDAATGALEHETSVTVPKVWMQKRKKDAPQSKKMPIRLGSHEFDVAWSM